MDLADVPRHRPMAFDKMEALIKEMQDPETGVPVRSQKIFLSIIPSAFMGYDLVEWLMDRFNLDEASNVEAINLGNLLCQHGYFFPVNDLKNLVLKDDSSLYRFQSPYYWPWTGSRAGAALGPDNVEYAIYLVKRTLRNKQRHALDDYEAEALTNLKRNLAAKWEFITMQAEEQVRLAKDRKKGDKIVSDSQERAYWRVVKPPPGVPSALEPCPVPVRVRNNRPKKRTAVQIQREIDHLKASLDRTRVKSSVALEALVTYSETFAAYDPWLTPPQPSNPWISDDTLYWQINSPIVEIPSEKRVQRWALSIEELVNDPTGLQEFTSFLRKEYSHENIRFWLAVMDLRKSSTKAIPGKLQQIYEEFLKPGAPCEINIDGATADKVAEGIKTGSRYALDHAAEHVYNLLLKKDCYPRFVRSDHFQRLLAEGKNVHQKKAKFFNFGGGQVKKKPGCSSAGASSTLTRRRGSDRSLSGSAHELGVLAAQPPRPPDPSSHSHSQSNLLELRDGAEESSDDVLPWEACGREAVGPRRRQDSAADSGSSSSDISAVGERRRLPQQSTLDGGLRGAPPPLRRLSAVEPRHLPPAASPPRSPRPMRVSNPLPTQTHHPTPTISVSSAPDETSPDRDDPPSVFGSTAHTPVDPEEKTLSCDSECVSEPSRSPESRTLTRETTIKDTPASSKDSRLGDLPESSVTNEQKTINLEEDRLATESVKISARESTEMSIDTSSTSPKAIATPVGTVEQVPSYVEDASSNMTPVKPLMASFTPEVATSALHIAPSMSNVVLEIASVAPDVTIAKTPTSNVESVSLTENIVVATPKMVSAIPNTALAISDKTPVALSPTGSAQSSKDVVELKKGLQEGLAAEILKITESCEIPEPKPKIKDVETSKPPAESTVEIPSKSSEKPNDQVSKPETSTALVLVPKSLDPYAVAPLAETEDLIDDDRPLPKPTASQEATEVTSDLKEAQTSNETSVDAKPAIAQKAKETSLDVKPASAQKVNEACLDVNPASRTEEQNRNDICPWEDEISSKPRFRSTYTNKRDNFNIIIKPKLFRSNSCSELTANSELNLDFINSTSQFISEEHHRNIYGSTGDSVLVSHTQEQYSANYPFMSWSFKGKKTKKKRVPPENMASKFASEYVPNFANEPHTIADTSLSTENSSSCSIDPNNKEASFPFKHTPSGNFKVQSNQVVFQSSTVGVLLADPTQAKVKVKFEGKTTTTGGDMETGFHEIELSSDMEAQTQYTQKEVTAMHAKTIDNRMKTKVKEEEGKDLESLGYALAEPIDWLRIQLPKKQDLFQEFYRRIHNYVNTDTVVHIGDDTFHCHHIVLQVYSEFFDQNRRNEMELPVSNVTPEAFQTVYEWMIFNGADSNKLLKRENVLEVFCAAQYLSIKDLEDQCWSFIVNENLFTEDTAFILFRQAREKGMTPVMDLMTPRIMRFFLPLVASKDFLDLEPEEVMTFLKSNYICVTSEIEVLMAGVRWLYGDWTNRRRLAVDVMRCVRFGLISPWQLVDIKRNPDNAEILEIVNEPEVQQMVDDGLAYVIIKYWYGNNSKNYYHWIDVLGLVEPAERNWIGEEKNHVTYKDFLKYLQQFMVPKEQFQQMAVMQPPRRSDEMPGTMRGMEDKMHLGRPKFDFPLPATLKNLTVPGDKDKSFPTMSEFFENRRKAGAGEQGPGVSPGGRQDIDMTGQMHQVLHDRRRSPDNDKHEEQRLQEQRNAQLMQAKQQLQMLQQQRRKQVQQVHMCTVTECKMEQQGHMFDPPERDSSEELPTTNSESSSDTAQCSNDRNREKRHSIAASYLASATAAMHGPGSPLQGSRKMSALPGSCLPARGSRSDPRAPNSSDGPITSPQISLFNQSKESLAKINMNKLSNSILGPSNKNYIAEGSLFNWDRETVLVFGGIDPHTSYGTGRNNGKDMFRFDPVTNVWDYVGDLPEPRHHHSVAFLRGRVYLVGGADPRDDDIRGKSVVVSTVWSYEPVSRSWYSENGLAVPRKNFGLVVHRMALYAIGGQDKRGRVLSSVERFDPKTGSWAEVRPMGVARMAVATVKYRDYIWVAGGMTGEKKKPVCKIVECYNSRTNEWTEIHSLRFPRCFATLFSMNDKLYIVGGAGKVSGKDKTASSVGAIDVWDWKDREWKLETEMSIPRHGHALAYLGTQLIIIGGVTTIYMRALSNVESFCCERGAWIRGVTPLPSPLSGHGAVTLPPASLM